MSPISSHLISYSHNDPATSIACIHSNASLQHTFLLPKMCMLLNLRIGLSLYVIPKQTPQELEDPKDYRLH